MTTSVEFQVLRPEDLESVHAFEIRILQSEITDPTEREFMAWHAHWRKEALQHYLPLGWSFGAFTNGQELRGYFLAQPLLFFGGLTQVLWVEHLSCSSDQQLGKDLADLAFRWARDKRMQQVVFPSTLPLLEWLPVVKPERLLDGRWAAKATRFH